MVVVVRPASGPVVIGSGGARGGQRLFGELMYRNTLDILVIGKLWREYGHDSRQKT